MLCSFGANCNSTAIKLAADKNNCSSHNGLQWVG